ncbi:Uncharacterised protein [Vibrio cholerae]|nr:Uncharacterised protein [Vibrio cholerae]
MKALTAIRLALFYCELWHYTPILNAEIKRLTLLENTSHDTAFCDCHPWRCRHDFA